MGYQVKESISSFHKAPSCPSGSCCICQLQYVGSSKLCGVSRWHSDYWEVWWALVIFTWRTLNIAKPCLTYHILESRVWRRRQKRSVTHSGTSICFSWMMYVLPLNVLPHASSCLCPLCPPWGGRGPFSTEEDDELSNSDYSTPNKWTRVLDKAKFVSWLQERVDQNFEEGDLIDICVHSPRATFYSFLKVAFALRRSFHLVFHNFPSCTCPTPPYVKEMY